MVSSVRNHPFRVITVALFVLVVLPTSGAATAAGTSSTANANFGTFTDFPATEAVVPDVDGGLVNGTGVGVNATSNTTFGNESLSVGGSLDGSMDGVVDENLDLSVEGTINGSVGGTVTGSIGGTVTGSIGGTVNGSVEATIIGSLDGSVNVTVNNGNVDGAVSLVTTDASPGRRASGGAVTSVTANEGASRESEGTNDSAPATGDSGSSPSNGSPGSFVGDAGMVVAGVAVVGVAAGSLARYGTTGLLTSSTTVEPINHTIEHGRRVVRARLPWLVAPFGYSRYDDSDPLEHEVRSTLYEAVESEPGINLSRLADRTTVSLSSVRHHLDVLADENLVRSELIQGKRCYFRPGANDVTITAALDDPATASVLTTLASDGPSTVSTLAEAMDLDPSTVSHHLSRLESDGVVERERDGKQVVTTLVPAANRAMGTAEVGRGRPSSDGGHLGGE